MSTYNGSTPKDLDITTPTEGTGLSYIPELNDAVREIKTVYKNSEVAVVDKNADYTATASDCIIIYTGTWTCNFPQLSSVSSATFIKRWIVINAGVGVITLDGYLTETLNGTTTYTLNPKDWVEIFAHGGTDAIVRSGISPVNAQTITANHTFSGTITLSGSLAGTSTGNPTLSGNPTFSGTPSFTGQPGFNKSTAGAPFTIGVNAQGQTVTGLKSDDSSKVGGFLPSQTPGANEVCVKDANAYLYAPRLITTNSDAWSTTSAVGGLFGVRTSPTDSPDGSTVWGFHIPHGSSTSYWGQLALRNNKLWFRTDEGGTIGPWHTVWHSGNDGPYFEAQRGTSDQTGFTSTVAAKVQFNNEVQDSASNYDNATNYRFTPTIAGMYTFSVGLYCTASSALVSAKAFIYKNGGAVAAGFGAGAGTEGWPNATRSIYMNGSTDYVEGWVEMQGTGTLSVKNSALSYFTGARAK